MTSRRNWAAMVASAILVASVAGCGGSGSSGSGTAPTATTRSRVRQLFASSSQSLTQAGYQSPTMAAAVNSNASALVAPTASGTAANTTAIVGTSNLPMVAAFLRNTEANAAVAATTATKARHIGRQVVTDPIVAQPVPSTGFYFDYYLGLWVDISEGPGQSTYSLYVDEAKTQPAGSIVTVWPTDYTVYPQTYHSTYSFTAGYLSGSHGDSLNVTNADGSSTASYNDTYADGSKDKGTSTQTAQGDYTWTGRTDAADGSWTTVRGTFRSDGSGGTHLEMSDGYVADYVYNADGSGHGRITGPDPGLPVTITYDAYGNTTITYADGTTEVISSYNDVTPVSVPGSSGGSSGSAGSGTTTTSTVAPPSPASN